LVGWGGSPRGHHRPRPGWGPAHRRDRLPVGFLRVRPDRDGRWLGGLHCPAPRPGRTRTPGRENRSRSPGSGLGRRLLTLRCTRWVPVHPSVGGHPTVDRGLQEDLTDLVRVYPVAASRPHMHAEPAPVLLYRRGGEHHAAAGCGGPGQGGARAPPGVTGDPIMEWFGEWGRPSHDLV